MSVFIVGSDLWRTHSPLTSNFKAATHTTVWQQLWIRKHPTWPGPMVGGGEGDLSESRRSLVFGWGGVGQQMAGEQTDSRKCGGTITALSLCLPCRTILNKAQTQGLTVSATLGHARHVLDGHSGLLKQSFVPVRRTVKWKCQQLWS